MSTDKSRHAADQTTTQDRLIEHYQELESRWTVADRSQDYARLVIPIGNSSEPVHRWFHMKEAYSSQLVARLRKEEEAARRGVLRTLDPFCGGGTTLVSSVEEAALGEIPSVLGVERNPFLATVARAKIAGILGGEKLAGDLRSALPLVKRGFDRERRQERASGSTTLCNERFFPAQNVTDLLAIAEALLAVREPDVHDVLSTCLGATVERSGRLRRDGRALRFEPNREPADPWQTLSTKVHEAIADLEGLSPKPPSWRGSVLDGDARDVASLSGGRRFDWIVFSPPYPNNIDYTEVYKTENWVLGAWSSGSEMRGQRRKTLRSHPSVVFRDQYNYEASKHAQSVRDLIDPIVACIPAGRYERGRIQLIQGYADDMLTVMHQCRRVVAPAGRLVYVVGNSLHGADNELLIAADLIIARLAELAGWRVEEIRVARRLKRRNSDTPFLRESVVVLVPA